MPTVIEGKRYVSLNDHISEYLKADLEFIKWIQKGVRACHEGKVKRWVDVKAELGLH